MESLTRHPARLLLIVLVGVIGMIVALSAAAGAPAALAIGDVLRSRPDVPVLAQAP